LLFKELYYRSITFSQQFQYSVQQSFSLYKNFVIQGTLLSFYHIFTTVSIDGRYFRNIMLDHACR